MQELALAIGLLLFVEGLCYALFPGAMKRLLLQVLAQPLESLRAAGLAAAALGVAIVWLVRTFLG